MTLYTALGDSITAGESATAFQLAYPSLIVSRMSRLRNNRGITGEILAEPGFTSAALSAAVAENSPVYLSNANAITVWIGGDDLAQTAIHAGTSINDKQIAKAISQYEFHLGKLIRTIKTLSKAAIIVCTQYNPFPHTPLACTGIRFLNQATQSVCQCEHVTVAPVHTWFEGRQPQLIAGYRNGRIGDVFRTDFLPIHPNNLGHEVIAQGLYPYIQAKMVSTL